MGFNIGRALSSGASGAGAGASFGPWGAAIGGGAGLLSSLFGGEDEEKRNPMEAANPYYNKIPGELHKGYDPSINAGNAAMPGYQDIMQKLLSNPQEFINMLGKGYQKSPGYDFNLNQAQGGINNAAAAGGMLGTPQHQFQAGAKASDFANQDFNSYMDRVLRGLGLGAAGTEGIVTRGQNASTSLADNISNHLMNQGNMAYGGAIDKNQQARDERNNLFSGIGAAGTALNQRNENADWLKAYKARTASGV